MVLTRDECEVDSRNPVEELLGELDAARGVVGPGGRCHETGRVSFTVVKTIFRPLSIAAAGSFDVWAAFSTSASSYVLMASSAASGSIPLSCGESGGGGWVDHGKVPAIVSSSYVLGMGPLRNRHKSHVFSGQGGWETCRF
ncbi:hypothetical protein DOTSEDRAFT_74952 [Dothistroma septosporum NZE10]|uniref:Uncharacterized protein n=1 Tax=Dothistroma septosporum (strain NZE10 / CBS 128990) TaxID=675120 RepID=N1PCP6_DOTSN|nr:hypothetical protein DOTSEDRAFT_74952 [Dothistroma septosporum NZE10]